MIDFLDKIDDFWLNAADHEFLMVVLGCLVYWLIRWSIRNNIRIRDIYASFAVGLLTVVFDDEILAFAQEEADQDLERFHHLVYISGGPLFDLLKQGIKKLTRR